MRVLLISNDQDLVECQAEQLGRDGFRCDAVATGTEGSERATSSQYEAIVLDAELPDVHEFDVLRQVCRNQGLAVIVLTASREVTDRVITLELGADDVIVKPVSGRELSARLRSILRRIGLEKAIARSGSVEREGALQNGTVRLLLQTREVRINGESVQVTAAECAILERLLQASGDLVSKDELSRHALGRKLGPDDRSIDTHISRLRRKLRHIDPAGTARIQSVRGRGYMLPVTSPEST